MSICFSRAIISSILSLLSINSKTRWKGCRSGGKKKMSLKKFTRNTNQIRFVGILLSSWDYLNSSRLINVIQWSPILNGYKTSCTNKRWSIRFSTWFLVAGTKLFLSPPKPSISKERKTICNYLENRMGTKGQPMTFQNTKIWSFQLSLFLLSN